MPKKIYSKLKLKPKEVGQRLREIRLQNSVTQEKLAKDFGFRRQHYISRYEIGGRIPSAEVLLLYSNRFSVSINWLLTGKEVQRQQAEKVA